MKVVREARRSKRPTLSISKTFRFLAQLFLGFYRAHLSGVFGGVCRYEPSCSCYAEQAFQQYPPSYALCLTIRRLLRCHPFASFGIDPVPPPIKENAT